MKFMFAMFAMSHLCLLYPCKLAVHFQFTSNNTTFLMPPQPGKLAEEGITAYTLSVKRTRKHDKLDFYNVFSIFTVNHHFSLLNIYPRLLRLKYSFQSF